MTGTAPLCQASLRSRAPESTKHDSLKKIRRFVNTCDCDKCHEDTGHVTEEAAAGQHDDGDDDPGR